jgi:hypothetical protein
MNDPIERLVNRWVQNGEERFSDINLQINHLHHWLFSDYEPGLGPNPSFLKRLADWLNNVADESDQKVLFELVPHLFYVGREELNVLYREAYHAVFARWLIDQVGVNFTSANVLDELRSEVCNTWFCPFTDSLRINQFYHINDIPGKHDHRPDWRSLRTFGDTARIQRYIEKNGIKRMVLLEDFIGNGGQISKAVTFAATDFPNLPILVVPLIICPKGMEQADKFMKDHSNVKIVPVVALPDNYFIKEIESEIELEFFKKVHGISVRTYGQVANSTIADDEVDPYGPFGWRKTGGLVVMHTNTPNNSLPLLHNKSATWNPLFKRHKRI